MVIKPPIRVQPAVNDQSEVQKRTHLIIRGINQVETTKRNRKNKIEKIRNTLKNNEQNLQCHLYEKKIMIHEKEMFKKKVISANIEMMKRKKSHVIRNLVNHVIEMTTTIDPTPITTIDLTPTTTIDREVVVVAVPAAAGEGADAVLVWEADQI